MNTLSKIDKTVAIIPSENEQIEAEKLDLFHLIHDDNTTVADLFFQFTQAEDDDEKKEIFDLINDSMHIHSQIVEEFLFPAVIDSAEEEDKEDAEKLVAVSEAGNYVAALLLDELEDMEVDDDFFEAKMTILCELTKKQVKREEKEMFEKLRIAEVDVDDLGERAAELKADLEEQALEPQPKVKPRKTAKVSKAKSPAKKSTKSPAKNKAGTKKSSAKAKTRPTKKSAPKAKAKAASKPAKKAGGKTTKKKSR